MVTVSQPAAPKLCYSNHSLHFLTAKTAEAERRKAIELGADDYLTKPCTVEDLLKAIAKVLLNITEPRPSLAQRVAYLGQHQLEAKNR